MKIRFKVKVNLLLGSLTYFIFVTCFRTNDSKKTEINTKAIIKT